MSMRFGLSHVMCSSLALYSLVTPRAPGDPAATGVSPASATPGQNITVRGTGLERDGFVAELQYTKKYRATTGESPTAVVAATSQTSTALVFPAPSNMLPTGLALRYHTIGRT